MLLAMNIGSLFYVALKGAIRGSKWQYIYLNACIINWVSELLFVQLIEILWIDFMVAGSIRKKVLFVSNFINSFGFTIYNKSNNFSLNINYISWLNTLKFYSQILCTLKPDLFESELLSNINYIKNKYDTNNNYNISNNNSFNNIFITKNSFKNNRINSNDTILTIIFGLIPFELHRII